MSVDVPPTRPLHDSRGRPVTRLRHYVGPADAGGFLQFATRPDQAPVVHFGGPWVVRPNEGQKLVLGRPEEFTARIGTPGRGPGTLAVILYHTLDDDRAMFVPESARVVLDVEFPGKAGPPVRTRSVLTDRC